MTKRAGRRRVTVEAEVINYYEEAGIAVTIARFFPGVPDATNGPKRKLVSKWKHQRAHIERCAAMPSTVHHQSSRDCGTATTLPPTAETSIVKWVNDFRRDGVPVSATMLYLRALEVAESLGIPSGVFLASWQWREGFMKRHRFSFRVKTRTGQIAPPDTLAQAAAFSLAIARKADVEGNSTIYHANQTAVFFELLPRTTITDKGAKTICVECGKKEMERMTAMALGDSNGNKHPLFLVMKTQPPKLLIVERENKRIRHGSGHRLWAEVELLQEEYKVRIYGNQSAWWTGAMTVEFLRFHFGCRKIFSDPVMLLFDDFRGRWIAKATEFAKKVNVVLMKSLRVWRGSASM